MKKIQELRLKSGLSQSQLAEKADLKIKVLQKYELNSETNGRDFDGANLKTILKVCIALDCSLEEIIEDEETKKLLEIVKWKW